jgi:hypothetical protein
MKGKTTQRRAHDEEYCEAGYRPRELKRLLWLVFVGDHWMQVGC